MAPCTHNDVVGQRWASQFYLPHGETPQKISHGTIGLRYATLEGLRVRLQQQQKNKENVAVVTVLENTKLRVRLVDVLFIVDQNHARGHIEGPKIGNNPFCFVRAMNAQVGTTIRNNYVPCESSTGMLL